MHFIHPQTAPFGEDDTGYGVTVKCFVDLGQHPLGISQAERFELGISQHTAPAVKDHHGLGARFDLCIEVSGHGIGVNRQDAVHEVRALVHQRLDQTVVAGARTFDHVTSQRPRTAREADQRHPTVQGFANRCDCIKHVLELGHVRHFQCIHGGLVANDGGKFGPLTDGKT